MSEDRLSVIVRPLPKVVFFYLTWIASGVFAAWPGMPGAGLIWMAAFFFNLLVISFDFNEERSIIFVLGMIVALLGMLYAGWLGAVSAFVIDLAPAMNRTFYGMVFGGLTTVFLFVWLNARFNYWEFRPNEVIHRYGVFPKMKRYSTDGLRWEKTVPDMLERVLLGAGRIVITTPLEDQPMIIDHVVRIGSVDDRIANIMGVRRVVATTADGTPVQPEAPAPAPAPTPAPAPPPADKPEDASGPASS